ncbi:hypothetical protein JW710_04230 [Candidatus Dojkabacteria bacterium]|nr:hypothetical protein [Candidatus Dojkabacteria bacterium]
MDISNLGQLGDLAKKMQDAYSGGTDAMNKAGKEVAKDMNPDHQIEVEVVLSAKIEGHDYKVDATITFDIELEPVLRAASSEGGDLAAALEGLDVDLGDDKDAVLEQLGQPRAVGVVKDVKIRSLELYNDEGKVETGLNKEGTLLATIKDGKVLINFESVLSYPEHSDVYVSIPSMEEMQKNIVVDIENLCSKAEFSWKEKDKDNLTVSGSVKISKK